MEYSILHLKRGAADPSDSVRGGHPWAASQADVTVERDRLDAGGLAAVQQHRSVLAYAPCMPTRLIDAVAAAKPTKRTRGRGAPARAQVPKRDAWGIDAVRATSCRWTGAGACVAVLDTGIARDHPAFAGVDFLEQDFTRAGARAPDVNGHGTHCAGTIFGRDVNGTRIGVARGVTRALIGKVVDDGGRGDSNSILRGIEWAFREGAQVISMSLAYDFPAMTERYHELGMPMPAALSQTLMAYRANLRLFDRMLALLAAHAAIRRDALVVAATGNESSRPDFTVAASLPAMAHGVLAVGAVRTAAHAEGPYSVANFSNTDPHLVAPGDRVLSARAGGGLVELSGTSMAAPHVAGVAALHWEALGQAASASLVDAALRATARRAVFAAADTTVDYGAGLVTAPQ